MYFPFLRGKQYELILVRENANLLANQGIIPVLEPVRANLAPLRRCLDSADEAGASVVVIGNPVVGDFANNNDPLMEFLRKKKEKSDALIVGCAVGTETERHDITAFNEFQPKAFIHLRQVENKDAVDELISKQRVRYHVFAEEQCGKLYRRKFREADASTVLLRDGFIQRRNSDYSEHEHFSDLHFTYEMEGVDGFGDYLIVGSPYQEGGGPAYAVVIHVTYIDDDGDMHVCHFRSDRDDSPADPGGKFYEAVSKLVLSVDEDRFPIRETRAISEFRNLLKRGHYPGLGYVKKLCMQHHVETIASFLSRG